MTRSWLSFARCLALATGLALSTLPAHALQGGTSTTSFVVVGELGGTSGVLIADNWVLTAAHVAKALSAGSTFTSLQGSSVISAVELFSNQAFPANDIALVQLATAITGEHALLNDTVVLNSHIASLGPLTAASAQNQQPNGYAATTAVAATVQDDVDAGANTVNWLITEGGTVQGGDSGSALFLGQITDSSGATLLGIASALISFDDGRPSQSGYVQMAAYKSWIDDTLGASGQQATWVSAVPEPSLPILLIAGGLIAGIAARRGQRATR
ncbi:MAG: trypsin-like serine protease [Aquabacterium sp.]|jgi:hypothetical protein|uniref:trypsin-like serine protease n=1 Tax=Aquabacterium sp. TaxID=1872578 RepID=UPI003BB14B08